MDFITDYSPALLSGINLFTLYNQGMEVAAADILKLSYSITSLSDSLDKAHGLLKNTPVSFPATYAYDGIKERPLAGDRSGITSELEEKTQKREETLGGKTFEILKSSGEVLEGGLKIFKHFSTLPSLLEKFEGGLGVVNNTFKVFSGLNKIAKVLGTTEAIEGLAAAGGTMLGAESVAAVASPFGPVGWGVAAGALVAGGITSYMEIAAAKRKAAEESDNFFDRSVEKKDPYFLGIQQSNAGINELINKVKQPSVLPDEERIRKAAAAILNSGGDIRFDDEREKYGDAIALTAIQAALAKSELLKNHPIKGVLFYDEKDRVKFSDIFDPGHQFNLKMDDAIHLKNDLPEIVDLPDELIPPKPGSGLWDKMHSIGRDAELYKRIQGYRMYGKAYEAKHLQSLRKSAGNDPARLKEIDDDQKLFLKAQTAIDKRHETSKAIKQQNRQGFSHDNSGGNITINLNRPMIEHFTINTKDGKESIAGFRHKVEEVLLEILNSANAIQ